MGVKSDLYGLAGKIESECDQIGEIISRLENIKSELLKDRENIKLKADNIKED